MQIDEFYEQLRQDVLAEADADGEFREDSFFDVTTDHLVETGELDEAVRVPYRAPTRGIRVDGYGGDPWDASGTLTLLILDFRPEPSIVRLTGSEMDGIFRRLAKFARQALQARWRGALEETSPAFGLADLIAQRWPTTEKVRLLLITNRELSERVDHRPAGVLEGKPAMYSVWDIRRLYRATASPEPEVIEVDLANDFGGPLPILPARQVQGDHESYLAVVPGPVLSAIYDRWGSRLLEQNVRVFLQARSKVNRRIRDTLAHEPELFFAYNNGITATAEGVEISNDGDRLLLRSLRNFQVVNGGQTTASIHAATRNKVDISQTFIQMKLSVVDPDRAVTLVPKISEYANSQNRVAASDFFSNHPFHVRVEAFSRRMYAPSPDGTFQQSKWFYERARGQYADGRAHLTRAQRKKFDIEYPRRQRFTKTDLAKFLNVWEGRPHEVSLGAQKNFAAFAGRIGKAWETNSDSFNEAWYREAIAKAIVFRATERIVSAQPWYQGGFRANIVAYTIARIGHYVKNTNRAVDFEGIWRRQAPGPVLRRTIAVVAKGVHDVLIEPPEGMRNVTEWAKKQACWSRASAIRVEWPAGLDDELVSAEDRQSATRSARREQRQLNGIEAQMAIVSAGGEFWKKTLKWGRDEGLLSPTEIGVLGVAAKVPQRLPTEKQSVRVMGTLMRLQDNGYREELPPPSG
ncbi:AIPR family protein [Candidatus Palauibacter sp.]|uniref:AIPR family protein n=1 Tax=Candidatus Palauibacter sp. TaxID=3101350 RepID=UPI003B52567B